MGNVKSRADVKARRKDPAERRAEIVAAAGQIALAEGLERVTAKRVAESLGVVPGLVNHYFTAVDDLVAAAFSHTVQAERAEVYGAAFVSPHPTDQLGRLLGEFLDLDRDPVSLLWLDAWQASRRRPALLNEVEIQMDADSLELSELIQGGIDAGEFTVDDAHSAAVRIMALVDGHSVQAATRSKPDYRVIAEFVIRSAETELGLPAGALAYGDAARA